MEMVWHEGPCVAHQRSTLTDLPQPINEVLSIDSVPEYLYPLDTPPHHVMQGTRGIQSRLSGHHVCWLSVYRDLKGGGNFTIA